MARKTNSDQANVALSPEEAEVLDAIAFLDDASRSDVLRPAVAAFLREAGLDQNVRQVIEARRARRAEKTEAPRVTKLDDKRRTTDAS
jgi:hypothetical protein